MKMRRCKLCHRDNRPKIVFYLNEISKKKGDKSSRDESGTEFILDINSYS